MKYVSFDTWWGGFNNIRQSIELIAGISYMTGRKIILPPKIFIDHLCDHTDKSTFLKYLCISFNPKNWGAGDSLTNCLITNTDVKSNKKVIDLRVDDEYIHFPRNLFGLFYQVLNIDDGFKNKLREGLKVNKHIDEMAEKVISGDYNAIHVRLGDFSNTRKEQTIELRNELSNLIEQNFKNDKPLFIATDEKNFKGFKNLGEVYDIRFLVNNNKYISMILDTVICSNADKFLGTKYSTYTDYIHILRHYKNKKDFSKSGLNYSYEGLENKKGNYNWHTLFVEMY